MQFESGGGRRNKGGGEEGKRRGSKGKVFIKNRFSPQLLYLSSAFFLSFFFFEEY